MPTVMDKPIMIGEGYFASTPPREDGEIYVSDGGTGMFPVPPAPNGNTSIPRDVPGRPNRPQNG